MKAHSNRPLRVLLVDDDLFVHKLLGSIISKEQYSLASATNVGEAMQYLMNEPPDVVITDAMMPGESGFSLITKIKANAETANIPIILMTILEDPNGLVMDATGQADFRVSKSPYLSDLTSTLELARQLVHSRRTMVVHFSEAREPFMIAI
jgi:PleD family two-component response regulator